MKSKFIKIAAIFAAGALIGVVTGALLENKYNPDTALTSAIATTEAAEIPLEATTVAEQLASVADTIAESAKPISQVEIKITKGDTWGQAPEISSKYEVEIKNTSGQPINGWKAEILFNTEPKPANIWNGESKINGKTMIITPAEYNKEIQPDGVVTLGFISTFATDPTPNPQVKLSSVSGELKSATPAEMAAKEQKAIEAAKTEPLKAPASPNATPVAANGQLSVKNGKIVNQNNQPFIIKGVSTHGIAWYPQYINLESFKTLRDTMGVNTVRLALYSSTNEGYKKELHQKVDEGVKYASDLGMYVVIDWHVLGSGNPNKDKTQAQAFFTEMASKYKDYPNVIYEICNEPNGDVQWERDIKPYATDVIKTIRTYDNNAIIIVGTPTWSQDVDIAAASPLQGDNLVYALHFYAATHKDWLRDKATKAMNAGLPIIVSEFGITDASGAGNMDEAEGTKWMDYLDSHSVGRICWALSNKNEGCSIIDPSCNKTSGWTDADLSQQGKWLKKAYTK